MFCSSCMETEGDYENGMCKPCYEAMAESNKPVSVEEINALIAELEKEVRETSK